MPSVPFYSWSGEVAIRRHKAAIRRFNKAQKQPDARLPETTLHQYRHHFAVMHLRRQSDHQWIKNQLGHAPQSRLIYTTYGVYIGEAKLRANATRKSA